MTLDGLKQLVASSFLITSIVDDWQQKNQIICFKVDQYYYGAKPDVQRAGVQVWKRIENKTNWSNNIAKPDVDKKEAVVHRC